MISYLNHITDRQASLCTKEQWDAMVSSEQNAQYIKLYRKALKTNEKSAVEYKQRLQAVNFQGYDVKVLNSCPGSRKAADMFPTGLFMLDIDHIEKPRKVYDKLQSLIASKAVNGEDVALVHITPSGKGLRIVMKGRPGSTIEQDQQWLADTLGVEHDAATKDLSRWSFVPLEKEILAINKELLFAMPFDDVYPLAQEEEAKEEEVAEAPTDRHFPDEYKGIPYAEIVKRFVGNNGVPEPGERHMRLVELALDLRYITDNNVEWLMQIMPDFDKSRMEKLKIVRWAVLQPMKGWSKRMTKVMELLKDKYLVEDFDKDARDDDEQLDAEEQGLAEMPRLPEKLPSLIELLTSKVMPFQKAAVASMVFPPLQAHIQNCKFLADDSSPYEMSGMCVLVGRQSVGKSCVDNPIDYIMEDIAAEDHISREREHEWAQQQQTKKATEKGSERPHVVIRYLNNDITSAALVQRLFFAENYGERKNLFTYTKVEEIEDLYSMAPMGGKSKISQWIKKCWDCGRIGSERYTSNAANYDSHLRWNWTACGTIERVTRFFQNSLVDGTLSRVDFATIIPPEEKFRFRYGRYDHEFEEALRPYIENLKKFECETGANGEPIPFSLPRLQALAHDLTEHINDKADGMETSTWRDFAWRTKMTTVKKILTLYIANGCQWEDSFEDFFWYSFNYSMWCKMNLFYEQATEGFARENIVSKTQVRSIFDMLPPTFTRQQFYDVHRRLGYNTLPCNFLAQLKYRGRIQQIEDDLYQISLR